MLHTAFATTATATTFNPWINLIVVVSFRLVTPLANKIKAITDGRQKPSQDINPPHIPPL